MSRSNEGPSGAEKLASLLADIRRMKEGLLQHAHSGAVRNNPTYEPSDEPTTRASPPQAENGLRVELPMDLDESLEDMVAKDAQLQYILSPQAEEQVRKSQRLDASSTPGGNAGGAFAGSSPSTSAASADQRTAQPWHQAQRGGGIASHQLPMQDASTTSSFQTPIRGPPASAGASPASAAPTTSDATSASALRTPATSTPSSRKLTSRIARPPGSVPPSNSSTNTTPAAAGAAAVAGASSTSASAQHTPAPAAATRPLHGAIPATSSRSATHSTPASHSTPSTATPATATRLRGAIGSGAMSGGTLAFGRHSSATGTPSARSSGSLSNPATGPSPGGHPPLGTRTSGPSAAGRQSSLDAAAPAGIARKRPLTASSDGSVAGGPAARRSGAGNTGVGAATTAAAGPAGQGTTAKSGRAVAGAGTSGSRTARPGVGSTAAAVAQMLGTGHGGQSRASPASSPRGGAAAAAAAAVPAPHRSAKALSVEPDASELQCQPSQPSLTLPTVGTTGDLMDETLESYMAEDPALSHFLAATAMEDAVQASPSAASTPLGAGARPDSEELLQPLADAAAAATAGGTLMDEDADEEMILLLGNTGAAAHGPGMHAGSGAPGGAVAAGVTVSTPPAVARSSVSIAELSPPAAASPASADVSPGAGAVGTPQAGTPEQQLRFATPGGAGAAAEAAGTAAGGTGAGAGGGPAASPKPALGTTAMKVSALLGLGASPPGGSGSEASPGPPQRESSEELWRTLRDEANSVYERNATPQHQPQQQEQQQQSPLAGAGSLEAATAAALRGLDAPPATVRSPGAGSFGGAEGALLLPVRTSSAGMVLSRKESMSIGPQAHTVTLSEDEDASHTGTPVAAVAAAAAARADAGAGAGATTTAAGVMESSRVSYGGADFEDEEVLAAAAAAAAAAVATPSGTPRGPFEAGAANAAAAVAAGSTVEPEAEMAESDRQPYQRSMSSTSSVGFDAAVAFEAAQVSRMLAGGSVSGGASWSEGGRVGSTRASAGGMGAFGAVPEVEAEGEVEAGEAEAGEGPVAEAEGVAVAMEPEAGQAAEAEEAGLQEQELLQASVDEEVARDSAAGAAAAAAAATAAAAGLATAEAPAPLVTPAAAPVPAPGVATAAADSPSARNDEGTLVTDVAMQAAATTAETAAEGADATVLAPRQVALLQEQHQQQHLLPASSGSSAVEERFFSAISAAPPPVEALALVPAASAASSTAAELPLALATDAGAGADASAVAALEDPAAAGHGAAIMLAAGGSAAIAAVGAVALVDADMLEAGDADLDEEMYDDALEDGFAVSAGGAPPLVGGGLGRAGLECPGAAAALTWTVAQDDAVEAGAAVQCDAAGAGAVVQENGTEAGAVVHDHAMDVAPSVAAGSEAGVGGAGNMGTGAGSAAGGASGSSDADADEDAGELPAKLRKTVTEGGVFAGAAVLVEAGGSAAAADGDVVGEGQAAGEEVEGGSRKRARPPVAVPVAEGMQGGTPATSAQADAAGGGEVSGSAGAAAERQEQAGEVAGAADAREGTQPGTVRDRGPAAADIPRAVSPGVAVAAAAGSAVSSGFAAAEQQLAGVSSDALAGPDGASRAPSDASRKSAFELGPGSTVLSNAAEGSVSKAIDAAVTHANLQHIPPEALPSDTFSLALDDSSRPHGSTPTAGFSAATSPLSNAGQPPSPSASGAPALDIAAAAEAGTAAVPAAPPEAGASLASPAVGMRGQKEQDGGNVAPSAVIAGTAAVPAALAHGATLSSPGEPRQGQDDGESGGAVTSAVLAGAAMAGAAAVAAAATTASPQAADVVTPSGPQPTPVAAASGAPEAPSAPMQLSGSGLGLPPRAPSSSSVPPAFPSTASHSPAVLSPSPSRGSPPSGPQPGYAAGSPAAAVPTVAAAYPAAPSQPASFLVPPPVVLGDDGEPLRHAWQVAAAATAGSRDPASGGDPHAAGGEYAAAARASLGTRPSLRSMRGGSAASSRLSRISSRRDADTPMEDVERVAEEDGEGEAAADGSGAATVVAVAVAEGARTMQNRLDGGDAMEVDGGRRSGGPVAAAAAAAVRSSNVSSNGAAGGDGEEQLVPAWKLVAGRSSSGPDGAVEAAGGLSGPASPAAVVPGMSPPLGSRKSLRSIMLPSGGSRLQRTSTRASESGEADSTTTAAVSAAAAAAVSAATVAAAGAGLGALPASPWGTEAAFSATGPPAAGSMPLPPPPPPPAPPSVPVDDDDVPLQPAWKVLAAPLAANLDAAQAVAAARSVPLGSQPSFRTGRTRSSRLHRASATDAEDTAGLGVSPPGAGEFQRTSNGVSPERHHTPMDLDHMLPPGASPTVASPGMAMGIPGGRSRARTQPGSSPGGAASVSFMDVDPAGGGGAVALPGMAPGIRAPVMSVSSGGGLARSFLRSTSSNVRRASAMEVPQPGSPRGGMSDNGSLAAMLAARISSRRLMMDPVGSVPLPRRSSCSGGDPNVDALRPAWQVLPLAMGLASGSNTPGGSSSSPGADGTPAGVPPTAAQMLGSMRSSSRLSRMSSGIPDDLLAELKAQAHAAVGHLQGSPGDQGEGGFPHNDDLLSSQDDADGNGGGGAGGGRPRHSVTVVTPPPPSGDGAGGTLHAWKMLPARVPATSASGLEHEQQQQQPPTSPGPLGFGPSPRASQMGGLGARPTLGMTRGANPSSRFAAGAAKPATLSSPQVTFETPRVVAPETDSTWATPPPTSMHAPPMQGAPFGAATGRLSASGAMQAGTHASTWEDPAAAAGAGAGTDGGVLHAWKLAIPPASAGSSGAPAATAGTTASTPTRPTAAQLPLGSRPSLKSIRTNSMGGSRLSRATSMADDYVDDSYSAPNPDMDIPDADGPGLISPAASRGPEPSMPCNVIGGDRTSAPAAIGALPPGVLYGSRPGLRSPSAAASPTRLDVVPSVGSASGAAASDTSTSSGSELAAAAGRPPLTRGTTTGSLNVPPALSVESGAPMGEATMARVLASRHSIRSNRSSASSRLSRMSSARDVDPNAMPPGVNAAAVAAAGQWDLSEIREEDGEGSLAIGGNSGRTSASAAALADRISPGAAAMAAARLSGSGAARPPALYVAAPAEEEDQQLLPAWKVLGNVASGEMGLAPGESPLGPAGSGGMGSVPTPLSSLSGRRSLRSIRSNSMGSSRLSRVSTAGDGALEDIVEEGTESASTMAVGAPVVGTDGDGSSSHDSNIAPERTSAGRAPPPAPSTGAGRIGAPVVVAAAAVGSGGFMADGALAPPAAGILAAASEAATPAAVAVAEEEKLLPAWKVLSAAEAAPGGGAVALDGAERVAPGSALGSIRQPSLRSLRAGSRLSRMTSNVDDKDEEEEEQQEQQQGLGQAAGGLVSPTAAVAAGAPPVQEAGVAAAFAGTAAAAPVAAGAPGSPRPAEAMEMDGEAAAAVMVPAPAAASCSGTIAAAAASALGYSGSEMDTGGLPAGPGGLSSVVDSATTTQSNLNITFATLPQFKSGYSKTSDTAPTPLSVSAPAAGAVGPAPAAGGDVPAMATAAGSPPCATKEEDALPSPAAASPRAAAAAPSAPASPAAAQSAAAVSHTDVEVTVAEEPQRMVSQQVVQPQQQQPPRQEAQPPAKVAKPKRRGGLFACFGCGCGVKDDEP